MRWWIWGLLWLLLTTSASGQLAPPTAADFNPSHPLARGLLSWWVVLPHLAAGPTWWATVGPYHGTLTNMAAGSGWATVPSRGTGAGVLRFDGVDDYVVVGTAPVFDCVNTTCTVTFRIETAATAGLFSAYVWGKRNDTDPLGGMQVRITTSGVLNARILDSGNTSSAQRSSVAANLYDGKVHTIAVVFTTDTVTVGNNNVVLYIDGQLDQGTLGTGGDVYLPCTCPLLLGATSSAGGTVAGFFQGQLSHVRFYTRALSALDVQADALVQPPDFGGLFVVPDLDVPAGTQVRRRTTID